MIPAEALGTPPGVVLDTNAVLDLLVFSNNNMATLRVAIEAGSVRWMTSLRMRDELARALTYPALVRWKPDSERTLTYFDRWSLLNDTPDRTSYGPLVCADPDDQVFMDLALATGALWLITHDRALLKLKRAAKLRGIAVLQPAQWSLSMPGS
jgi:predicted nucleic acid-binding protein